MKPVILFVATNLTILLVAALFGMGGSFVSLALSKWIAKSASGARGIEQPRYPHQMWLLQTLEDRLRRPASAGPR